MRFAFQKTFLFLCISLYPFFADAQNLTGFWKGYFITERGDSYRLEFQIDQNKDKSVIGVSYSYGDNINFYGKATMTGRYAIDNGFSIAETKTVEVKSSGGGTCLMNYKFTYTKSGKEEYLEGTYVGRTEDRSDPRKNGPWGDCGGGRVFLRRVQNSDFPVEPFLKDKIQPKTEETPATKEVPKVVQKINAQVPKPKTKTTTKTTPKNNTTAKKTVPKKTPTIVQKTPIKKPISKPDQTVVKKDTVTRKNTAIVIDKPVEKAKINIPTVTRSRQNELTQSFTVHSEEITIKLYDNGEIDNDTISVYLDGQLILSNKRLSTAPITYTIKLDENNPEHTLVMVAENLGRIPPNTSLMIVQDGDKRYSTSITSTEQKNAMVRFRYQKSD